MIIYYDTINENIINPTDEFLKDIIFNKSGDYWLEGSGDSCIEIDNISERLIFFYNDKYGFFIMRHPDYLVTYKDKNNKDYFIHYIGGEPIKIPITSCLTREEAYTLIKDFILGKEFNEDKWIELYEIIEYEE